MNLGARAVNNGAIGEWVPVQHVLVVLGQRVIVIEPICLVMHHSVLGTTGGYQRALIFPRSSSVFTNRLLCSGGGSALGELRTMPSPEVASTCIASRTLLEAGVHSALLRLLRTKTELPANNIDR